MARTPQSLASGVLSSGTTDIYTAAITSVVTNFTLTNTDTTIKSVDVYIDRGTAQILTSVAIPAGVGKAVTVSNMANLTLDAGDKITLTTTGSAINYDMSGWLID